ncbi:MAG: hypothetical protein IJU95_03840, partial [Treponema sp.]|nr:hypothetical protein [Treponema sp.]
MKNLAGIVSISFLIIFLVSCTGTGGTSDSSGLVYDAGSSSFASSSQAARISSDDILTASVSGGKDAVLELLGATGSSGGDAQTTTTTIALAANDIGLPSDGKVVLKISGGNVNYSMVAQADADGYVRFQIPRIASGTTVTVDIEVMDSGGTVLSSGSKTQTVQGDSSQIAVSLTGTGAIPKPVVTATCTGISVPGETNSYYVVSNSDMGSTSLTFSTSTAMPAGTEYEWFVGGTSRTGRTPTPSWSSNLGALGIFTLAASVQAYCVAYCDGKTVTSDPVNVSLQRRPAVNADVSKISIGCNGSNVSNGASLSVPSASYTTMMLGLTYSDSTNPDGMTYTWTVTGDPGTEYTNTAYNINVPLGNFITSLPAAVT